MQPRKKCRHTFQTPFNALAGKTYKGSPPRRTTADIKMPATKRTRCCCPDQWRTRQHDYARLKCVTIPVLFCRLPMPDRISSFGMEVQQPPTRIAAGSTAFTSVIRADKTYYAGRNDLDGKVEGQPIRARLVRVLILPLPVHS